MSNVANKVTAMDVIQYFKDADLEVAELALHVASSAVAEKVANRKAASERMAKARAGRKPKASATAATPAVTEAPAAAPAHRTAAAGRVPAPAHTAHSTSVESDTQVPA